MVAEIQTRNVFLIYIDESYDSDNYVYSAVFVDFFKWGEVFLEIQKWREGLFNTFGISTQAELHATEFVGGRGQAPINRDKTFRAQLFNNFLKKFDTLSNVFVINASTENKQFSEILFERLLNRIQATLKHKHSYGLLICDECDEKRLVSIVRRMKKVNNIYSQYDNSVLINTPLDRIIEDPLFKTSNSSYFLQIADNIAFSLLRNEHPVKGKTLPKVQSAFDNLDRILLKCAFAKDPKKKGIIRV